MIADKNYLVMVNEGNKLSMHETIPHNVLYYFELNDWFATNAFKSFSVKMVLNGAINYKIGNTIYPVKKNQALIGNKQPDVKSYFESKEAVKSVCLNIEMDTIAEAYRVMDPRKEFNLDNLMGGHYSHPSFEERIYNIEYNNFLEPLQSVALNLSDNKRNQIELTEEFFLGLSEKIVLQLFDTSRTYDNLECIRPATKKEILRRLDIAKNYLEENFLEKPSVAQVATYCNMSEFHFFRAFKQAFSISPYQLQLKLRLEKAKKLITETELSLTDISDSCAFPDLSTFSKAYKRMYNTRPSEMRK